MSTAVLAMVVLGCSPTGSEAPAAPSAAVVSKPQEPLKQGTAFVRFGRSQIPQEVRYVAQNGWAIAHGDILLGRVEDVEKESARLRREVAEGAGKGRVSAQGAGLIGSDSLWTSGEVPFTFDASLSESKRQQVRDAMTHWERRTVIRFIERQGCGTFDGNCVNFQRSDDNRCNSHVGRLEILGADVPQDVNVADWCGTGSLIHEIGHVVGLYHEQSRSDRDLFIDVIEVNFASDEESGMDCMSNYDMEESDKNVGAYDYGSIMHYPAISNCSARDANGTQLNQFNILQPLPPGVTVGQRNGLSAGDITSINRMYGSWVSRKYLTLVACAFAGVCESIGSPTSDEGPALDWGRFQHFLNGSIYWHPDAGVHVVRGQIRSKWEELGWERGLLGFPTTDTEQTADGQWVNHFQYGSIFWSAATGYRVVVRDGTPVREEGQPSIWVYQGGGRFWVPSGQEWTAYRLAQGLSEASIRPAPRGFIASTPQSPEDGTVVRERGQPSIWVYQGGGRFWVPSGEEWTAYASANGLSDASIRAVPRGSLWATLVMKDALTDEYRLREDLPRDGTVVRERGQPALWVYQGGGRFWVPSGQEWTAYASANGLSEASIRAVPRGSLWATLVMKDTLTDEYRVRVDLPRDGTVVRERGEPAIYVYQGGGRFWVRSSEDWSAWKGATGVTDASIRMAPLGSLTSTLVMKDTLTDEYRVRVDLPRDGTLISELWSSTVYVVWSGQKSVTTSYDPVAVKRVPPSSSADVPSSN
jgi:hypothetical protein